MPAAERLPVIRKPDKRKARSSRKLLIFLFIFFITLLIVLFFQSSLSDVTKVEVVGHALVSEETVLKEAAIQPGDHFFAVSSSLAAARIAKLPIVQSAEVHKYFPGKIVIEVKEHPKVAYQLDANGKIEALLADGSTVAATNENGFILDMPLLSGWSDSEQKKALCKALSGIDPQLLSDVSEIIPYPSQGYPDRIKMYTRTQFEVHTRIAYLPEKMSVMNGRINTLLQNGVSGGILKLLEVDSHIPYEALDSEPSESKQADNN